MTQKKKILIIIIIAFFFLCILSALCLGIAYKFFSSIISEGNEIKKGIISDVCESHGVFSEPQYKAWFSAEYRQSVDYIESMNDIQNIFPQTFDCSDLNTNNIIDFFQKGHSVSINYTTGRGNAEISFPKDDDEQITIQLVKVGNEWEIHKLSLTQTSG